MKVQILNNSDIARYFVLDSLISMYQTKMHTKYSLIVNCSTFYFSDEGLSFTSYDWVKFLFMVCFCSVETWNFINSSSEDCPRKNYLCLGVSDWWWWWQCECWKHLHLVSFENVLTLIVRIVEFLTQSNIEEKVSEENSIEVCPKSWTNEKVN